jgi:hypothetical protein
MKVRAKSTLTVKVIQRRTIEKIVISPSVSVPLDPHLSPGPLRIIHSKIIPPKKVFVARLKSLDLEEWASAK